MQDISALFEKYGYRIISLTDGELIYKQKPHARSKIWLLWAVTSLLGIGMLIRALIYPDPQDLLIAVAATLITGIFSWNNYRQYTRPFQVIIQTDTSGLTLMDKGESLHFPSDQLADWPLHHDEKAAYLFVTITNHHVKPLLFRLEGHDAPTLVKDRETLLQFIRKITQA